MMRSSSRRRQRGFLESLLSAAVPAVIGALGQKSANDANIAASRRQMEFQERMSSTAYQRATADMQAAGLNPMLAYSQGGASSPVGSMPQISNVAAAGLSSAAGAMNMMQSVQAVKQSEAQTELIQAQAEKVRSETMPPDMNREALERRLNLLLSQENLNLSRFRTDSAYRNNILQNTEIGRVIEQLRALELRRDTDTFSADVARRKAESKIREYGVEAAKADSEFWEKVGDMPQGIRMLMEVVRGLSSARGAIRGGL